MQILIDKFNGMIGGVCLFGEGSEGDTNELDCIVCMISYSKKLVDQWYKEIFKIVAFISFPGVHQLGMEPE